MSRLLVIGLALSLLLAACAPAAPVATTPAPGVTPPAAASTQPPAAAPTPVASAEAEFDVVQKAAQAYLVSDRSKTPNISAQDLYLLLKDEDPKNDPFILSVRAAADYAKGHIPGAMNIPWREVFKPENLAKLPRDRQIVVYCYTGHTGSQVTALLGMMGYNAINLKYGMSAWTKDPEIAAVRFVESKESKGYATETAPAEAALSTGFPQLENTASNEEREILRAAADAYLSSDKGKTPNIKAEDLFLRLKDEDPKNDPFILSVRAAADYARGHIPGAMNIPWRELGAKENLAKLPKDRQIVVYCYTGHTGSQATALLNALGYNAINLQFGMCAWSTDRSIASGCYDEAKDSMDYPFESS